MKRIPFSTVVLLQPGVAVLSVNKNEFQILVSSEELSRSDPTIDPSDFTVQFAKSVELGDQNWEVGLIKFEGWATFTMTGISQIELNTSLQTKPICSFVPNFSPGSLIAIVPEYIRYRQVSTSSISSIRFFITDGLGRPINFHGEHCIWRLIIRRIKS